MSETTAKVTEVFTHGTPVECIKRLVGLIRSGELISEFWKDPVGVINCISTVMAAIKAVLLGEEDDGMPEPKPDQPIFGSSPSEDKEFLAACQELCSELRPKVFGATPAGRGELLQILLPLLVDLLRDLLKK